MWNLKNYTNELIYKTEIGSQIENKLVVTKGDSRGRRRGEGGRDKLGV